MNQANNKHIDAMMMSPGTGGEMTPRSADPAFSWFNVNSPSLKSPKMIGNTSFFTGNFFSDAADLGFEKNQVSEFICECTVFVNKYLCSYIAFACIYFQSPAPYLKQNAKLPFSPVSTKMVNKQQKNTDTSMDAAERDVMEDEDLCLLIKLAQGSARFVIQKTFM